MTEPAEDQTVRPFADWLREQSKGLTHEELSEALRAVGTDEIGGGLLLSGSPS